MFSDSPAPEASPSAAAARPARRRPGRLTAICTSGVLAASALVLGQAGPAGADAPAPHTTTHARHVLSSTSQHAAAQRRLPTLTIPRHQQARSSLSANTTAQSGVEAAGVQPAVGALTTPWFDVDGDGVGDVITQEADRTVLLWKSSLPSTSAWQKAGVAAVQYKDLLTPGNLTDTLAGPELLTLTTTGHLSMWDHAAFPAGSPAWTGAGWNIYNKVIAIGDITGDGYGDLLARTPAGALYLYRGTGNAASPFQARVSVGSGYGIYDQLIGGGDLTATGHESLVARDLDGALWMYTLDGTKVQPLSPRVKIGSGWGVYAYLLGFGDDKDMTGSVIGRNAGGDLYSYQGNGAGGLGPSVVFGTGWTDRLVADRGNVPVWGKNGLLGLTATGNLYSYYGTGKGTLSSRRPEGDPGEWTGLIPVGSVSLTQADEQPLLEIDGSTLYNDTKGTNGPIGAGWTIYNRIVGPGDLTGEGNSDLLARDKSGVLWLYPGKGTGLGFYGRLRLGGGWGGYDQLTGAGDIDGDGFADIVARTTSGHLFLYRGTGNATTPFRPRTDLGGGWNTYSKLVAPGDLDGDGRADLLGVTAGGQLYRYSASGRTGTAIFKPRVEIGTGGWNTYSAIV